RARQREERGLDFLSGVGAGAMRTRLESPRVCYATPGLPIGTTRASRRRHAAAVSLICVCPSEGILFSEIMECMTNWIQHVRHSGFEPVFSVGNAQPEPTIRWA